MRPLQRDQIAVQPDGEVGVRAEHLTSPAGAFAGCVVTVCPVVVARDLAASVAPAAVRAARGGLPLVDLGVGALSDGGASVVGEIIAASDELGRLEIEEAKRLADIKNARKKGGGR